MRKENVFLLAGRLCGSNGEPVGGVVNRVVCAVSDDSMREFVVLVMPEFLVLSVVNLSALECLAVKVKSVLSGADATWPVFVEAGL